MSRHNALYDWTAAVTSHFPHLSKPQAAVLALWSFGIVLAHSCGLSAVANVLHSLLGCSWNTTRERLRDWYKSAADKSGQHRRELDVTTCFAPLLRWILREWPSRRVALALDATPLFDRLVVLSLSIVYRGTAVPVAWKVLRGNKRHAWKPEWLKLLHWFGDQVGPDWTVIVLTDRGLYAKWLFRAITRLGWHPIMRITRMSKFLPEGWAHPLPVWQFVPRVGRSWQGRGLAFPKKAKRRLPCTLLAYWSEGHEDGWYLLTDLPPQTANAAWYGLRMWIEHGYEQFKSTGWRWQKTRMTACDRADRLWLAMAVAMLWVVSIGGEQDYDQRDRETLPELPHTDAHRHAPPAKRPDRPVSVFQQGIALLMALFIKGQSAMPSRWHPESWPEIAVIIQEREHEEYANP